MDTTLGTKTPVPVNYKTIAVVYGNGQVMVQWLQKTPTYSGTGGYDCVSTWHFPTWTAALAAKKPWINWPGPLDVSAMR